MTSQKYTILYGRLSQDDGKTVESNSVTNQRLMLEKYALDNGFENVLFLADDGYTGTNFERPSWKQVEEMIKRGGGEIVGKAAVLAEGVAADRKDIIYLEVLPLFFND